MPGAKKRFTACKDAAHATVEKFYEFKNATETSVDLYFYGDIVSDWWGAWQEEDQYPEAIKNFLTEANGKDLNIYINSGGGSVFAGLPFTTCSNGMQERKPSMWMHWPGPLLPLSHLRTVICPQSRPMLI